jgi:hypothetical protein
MAGSCEWYNYELFWIVYTGKIFSRSTYSHRKVSCRSARVAQLFSSRWFGSADCYRVIPALRQWERLALAWTAQVI